MAERVTGRDDKMLRMLSHEELRALDWTKRRLIQGKKGKPCVYCGGAACGDTMDHVFPETLFDPVPLDAITVPSCRVCNGSKSLGDEALRTVVTLSDDAMPIPNLPTHLNNIARATARNQSPVGKAAWEAYRIRKQVDPLRMGGPLPVQIDGTELYAALRMMVRGLYFAVHGRILPTECPVEVDECEQERGATGLSYLLSDPDHYLGQRGAKDVQWLMSSPDIGGKNSALCMLLFRGGVFYYGRTGEFVLRHSRT